MGKIVHPLSNAWKPPLRGKTTRLGCSDMTTCIPKHNCAHRLLDTVCSEKVGGGGG